MDATAEEPLYEPQETILEDVLKREAEKIGYNETCINKVVYDSIDDPKIPVDENEPQPSNEPAEKNPELPNAQNCDNNQELAPWY